MKISARNKICIIIGDPIKHSLSPEMHNSSYEALGIDDQFVFVAARVDINNLGKVVNAVRVMNIRGLTCTAPHKIEVIKYLDEIDNTARKIGAVNTVVNNNGILKGYNTDWLGAVIPLQRVININNKKVALIGAGGVARSIVFGLIKNGAELTIYNRTTEKAKKLAHNFLHNVKVRNFDNLKDIRNADIIINATSIGMKPYVDKSPLPAELLSKGQIVFDVVYQPFETKLLRDAKKKGAKIISGLEMFLYQGVAQFEHYTNRKAPENIMRKVLYKYTC